MTTQTMVVLYVASVIAAVGADISVGIRANDIRKSHRMKPNSLIPPIEDLLLYLLPVFNIYCFISYSICLFFASDSEILELMEDDYP